MILVWTVIVSAALASFAGTAWVRRYALQRGLLDHPNARSSHSIPTPRGGGVAIALAFLAGLAIFWSRGLVASELLLALLGAGGWITLVGWIDDRRQIPARWRLIAHALACVWVFYWLGALPPLLVAGVEVAPAWVATAAGAVYLVWVLNLYNFMDGIDAIASIEAATVCLAGAVLHFTAAPGEWSWIVPALLLAAVAGFSWWNYPPAQVFMGDAGSGFLGLVLAVLAIDSVGLGQRFFWAWTILIGVFVVDASVTLLRRLWRRERIAEAHRSHAYQRAARRLGAHAAVSLTVGAINLLWLWPLAWLVVSGRLDGAVGMAIAYAPLVAAALFLRAGATEVRGPE